MEKIYQSVLENKSGNVTMDELWKLLCGMEGETFYTAKGLEFHYEIRGYEIFVDRKRNSKSITRSSVERVYQMLLERIREGEELPLLVKGPKKLGVFGASYLYPVLLRLGIIRSE